MINNMKVVVCVDGRFFSTIACCWRHPLGSLNSARNPVVHSRDGQFAVNSWLRLALSTACFSDFNRSAAGSFGGVQTLGGTVGRGCGVCGSSGVPRFPE